jgi:ribosome maturation factor RimP
MKQNDPTTETLLRIAEPVCIGSGYELVDLSLTPSREGWVLRVFIDHLPLPQVPSTWPAQDAVAPDAVAPDAVAQGAAHASAVADPGEGDADAEDTDDGADEEISEDISEISFEDCTRVSRELGAVLDVEDPIGHAYRLEVSSPGLDRPLRTLEHFQRFCGYEMKIKLHDGIDGRHNYKGRLLAVAPIAGAQPGQADAHTAIILEVDGKQHELPFDDIESARLVPDWDAIMGSKKPGKPEHS